MFGSIFYVHIPKAIPTKLDPEAKKCISFGYDSCKKGWKCMDPNTEKFVTSRDVVFDEVSTWHPTQKQIVQTAVVEDGENFEIISQTNDESQSTRSENIKPNSC